MSEKSFMSSEQQLDGFVVERKMWLASSKEHRELTARKVARKEALLDRSDPFAYSRAMSHMLLNNVTVPDDYTRKQ